MAEVEPELHLSELMVVARRRGFGEGVTVRDLGGDEVLEDSETGSGLNGVFGWGNAVGAGRRGSCRFRSIGGGADEAGQGPDDAAFDGGGVEHFGRVVRGGLCELVEEDCELLHDDLVLEEVLEAVGVVEAGFQEALEAVDVDGEPEVLDLVDGGLFGFEVLGLGGELQQEVIHLAGLGCGDEVSASVLGKECKETVGRKVVHSKVTRLLRGCARGLALVWSFGLSLGLFLGDGSLLIATFHLRSIIYATGGLGITLRQLRLV